LVSNSIQGLSVGKERIRAEAYFWLSQALFHSSSHRKNSHPHRMKHGGLTAFGGVGRQMGGYAMMPIFWLSQALFYISFHRKNSTRIA